MTERGMPECPNVCGGPDADLGLLNPDQLAMRAQWGCDDTLGDEDARYGVTCPVCNGAGCTAEVQALTGRACVGGQRPMGRCPGACQTPDIARALRAYRMMKDAGVSPVPGGFVDQAASFVRFCSVLEAEMAFVHREQSQRRRKRSPA